MRPLRLQPAIWPAMSVHSSSRRATDKWEPGAEPAQPAGWQPGLSQPSG